MRISLGRISPPLYLHAQRHHDTERKTMNKVKYKPLANALAALASLALIGCGTTGRDWKEANRSGTIDAYEQFLRVHADAQEATQAKQRLDKLRAEAEWKEALAADSVTAYKNFVAKHPVSQHASQAKEKMEQAQAERDWQTVKSDDSLKAYQG